VRFAMLLLIAACTRPPPPRTVLDLRPIATQAAPAEAGLYAACLADAAASQRYGHARDPSTSLLLFTCTGEPARAFYDALGAWSARIGSQYEHAGRTYRTTAAVRANLFGVDYCATDGTQHECVITLNVGSFVP
jgi:hypothetical protein